MALTWLCAVIGPEMSLLHARSADCDTMCHFYTVKLKFFVYDDGMRTWSCAVIGPEITVLPARNAYFGAMCHFYTIKM